MNVKSPLSKVTVSVTFRGLTEYNGRTLAFFNVTEDLWTGGKQALEATYFTSFHTNSPLRSRAWPQDLFIYS